MSNRLITATHGHTDKGPKPGAIRGLTKSPIAVLGQSLKKNTALYIGSTVLMALVLMGLILPLPFSPTQPDVGSISLAPNSLHWFGTDINGFDVFSRTVAAAPRDISLAFAGTLLSLLVGVPFGLFASLKGRTGELIMRGVDAFQSFPLLILAIAVVTLLGNNLWNVVAAISIINIPRFMRIIRSEALSIRESRFIEAAVAIGASRGRIIFVHTLPNVNGIILVQFSLAAANALMVIATMAFLGVGVSPPDPTWGAMAQEGAKVIANGQWWMSLFPCLAIFVAVGAFNLIADGTQRLVDRQQLA
jgi:peptide/nickel transport system permease protein